MRKVLLTAVIAAIFIVVLAAPVVQAAQCLINGDFEGGWVDGNPAGWKKLIPSVYCYSGYTADWQLFSDNLNGYPSLDVYEGRQSLGVYRVDGFQYNIARPQLEFYEFNVLFQYVKVEPNTTYNVKVSAAVFTHHDRMGDLDDFWGSGVSLRICPDWNNHSQAISFWRHDFVNSEGDSFWRYYPDLNNTSGTNTFTTGPSQTAITFNIVWYTKWNADIDLCAIDDIKLELSTTGKASEGSSDFVIKDPPTWKDPHRLWNPVDRPERWSRAGSKDLGDRYFNSRELTTGVSPVCSAVGDLNSDKLPDIAVACAGSHVVSIYMQQRDGSFREGKHITGAVAPQCVQIAQVVGSPALDMVVSSFGTKEVLVYPGDGRGSFQEPSRVQLPIAAGWFDIADINGDSNIDLAVCGLRPGYDGEIYVFTGNGSGQFKQTQVIGPVKDPSCLKLVDFGSVAGKLDGKPDIMVSTWWGPANSYTGNGDGTFTLRETLKGRSKSRSLSLSDLDGDKVPDACIPYAWTIGTMGHLQLAKGNGDCTFVAQEFDNWLAEPLVPRWVDTCDLNGDGAVDIVGCNQETSDIAVFFNSRSSEGFHFDYAGHYGVGDTNTHVLCRDINMDSLPDILVCSGSSQTLNIVYGEPRTATLKEPAIRAPRSWQKITGQRAVVAEAAQPLLGVASLEYFRVYRDFDKAVPAEVYSHKTVQPGLISTCVGLNSEDLNLDGSPDFVLTRTTGVGGAESLVFLSDPSGYSVNNYPVTEGNNAKAAVLVDVDGKNGSDIVTLEAEKPYSGVYCRLNDGKGRYERSKLIRSPLSAGSSPTGMTTGDFNKDGKLDVTLIFSGTHEIGLMLGDGAGRFQTMKNVGSKDEYTAICSADLNGDGRVDIAAAGSDGTVSIYTQDKNGAEFIKSASTLSAQPGSVKACDLDLDGIIDIAVSCPLERVVYVIRGRGNGLFDRPCFYRTCAQPLDIAVGQLAGSALPDMLVVSEQCELFEMKDVPSSGTSGRL